MENKIKKNLISKILYLEKSVECDGNHSYGLLQIKRGCLLLSVFNVRLLYSLSITLWLQKHISDNAGKKVGVIREILLLYLQDCLSIP